MRPGLALLVKLDMVQRAALWAGAYLLADLLLVVSVACWAWGVLRSRGGFSRQPGGRAAPPGGAGPQAARAWACLIAVLLTAVPVRAVLLGAGLGGGLFPDAARISRLLKAPLFVVAAAPPAAILCAVMSVRSWLKGYWTAAGRIHYALVAAGGAACAAVLVWWNLH
ncbi:MAG: hypothetical protein ACOC8N_01265 [Spirochaetota bacterium]